MIIASLVMSVDVGKPDFQNSKCLKVIREIFRKSAKKLTFRRML